MTNLHARIHSIYLASLAGAPMQSMKRVKVIAGYGIEGDRYALKTGAYSLIKPYKVRHLSLIASSGIDVANEWLRAGNKATFEGSETRRNIILDGITSNELNLLVGQQFHLGTTLLKGIELCTPCERPAQLLNRPSFKEAFDGRGGIRAEILISGELTVDDALFIENESRHD